MAQAFVMHACPENDSLLQDLAPVQPKPWKPVRNIAAYIIHSESDAMACEAAADIKQWLQVSCGLDKSEVMLHEETVSTKPRADEFDVAEDDLLTVADSVDAVILVQTSSVLFEARSLARIYSAVRNHVPVVAVQLTSSRPAELDLLYKFDAAESLMQNMERQLPPNVTAAVQKATHQTIAAVGKELLRTIPAIISKEVSFPI